MSSRNATNCSHLITQEEDLKQYMRATNQTQTLWTNYKRVTVPYFTHIKETGAILKAGCEDFPSSVVSDCKCCFLEAKGFPSTISPTFSLNYCGQRYGYICQKDDCSECPSDDCHRDSEGRCYHVYCSPSDWFGARQRCLSRGADLANASFIILKEQLEEKAFSLCQKTQRKFWLGVTNCQWVHNVHGNHSIVPSSSWLPGQPNGKGDCAVLARAQDGRIGLKVQPCDSPHSFLCENRAMRVDSVTQGNGHSKAVNAANQGSPSLPVMKCLLLIVWLTY